MKFATLFLKQIKLVLNITHYSNSCTVCTTKDTSFEWDKFHSPHDISYNGLVMGQSSIPHQQ